MMHVIRLTAEAGGQLLEQIAFVLNQIVVQYKCVNLLVLMCRGRFTT